MSHRSLSVIVLSLVWSIFAVGQELKAEPPDLREKLRIAAQGRLKSDAEYLSNSPDDALFLEGTLACLAAAESGRLFKPTPFELLHRLATRRWRAPRGESAGDLWLRQQADLNHVTDVRYAGYPKLLAAHHADSKEPAPQEWRGQANHWQDLFETVVSSAREKEPAKAWRMKIHGAGKHAVLYRRAYAAAAIAAKADLDLELIKPLLDPPSSPKEGADDLLRVAEVLHLLALSNCPPNEALRVDLQERLPRLAKRDLGPSALVYLAQLDTVGGAEQRLVRTAILPALNPLDVLHFAGLAGIPVENRRQLFLSMETKVAYDKRPLGDVLRELRSTVLLRMWIDDAALADESPVTLETSGPWLAVLERALAQTKHALEFRHSGEFWIGSPERKREAFATWDRALLKMASANGTLREKLQEPTTMELFETPLRDVLDYLADLHGTRFQGTTAALSLFPVSQVRRDLPLYLALELLAEHCDASWDTVGGVVAFGLPDDLERLRQFEARRRRLSVSLAATHSVVGTRLVQPTAFEFIETPLRDVCAYLSDLHNIPVVAASNSSQRKLTQNLNGVELGVALDLTCGISNLTWSSDGEAIYLGAKEEVDELLKLATSRERRRLAYPPDIAKALRKPLHADFKKMSLADAALKISEQTGIPIELDKGNADLGTTRIQAWLAGEPGDLALDLICLSHGLAWEVTEKGVRIQRGERAP